MGNKLLIALFSKFFGVVGDFFQKAPYKIVSIILLPAS